MRQLNKRIAVPQLKKNCYGMLFCQRKKYSRISGYMMNLTYKRNVILSLPFYNAISIT